MKTEKMEECRAKLNELANKKELYFTNRCNKSIDLAVRIALNGLESKSQKEKLLLIQEEGGWITYKDCAKKHKMALLKLKMKNGKIQKENLEKTLGENKGNAILLMHSLPGYSYKEDMKGLYELTKKYSCLLINDCCGSIGTDSSKIGDIIVCSFGKAKPLSADGGGFIAAENFSRFSKEKDQTKLKQTKPTTGLLLEEEMRTAEKINFQKLNDAIDSLGERLLRWKKIAKKTKEDLTKKGFYVLNKEEGGINVLVRFSDEEEKERLINYCKEKGLEYTECPRYIRTLEKALSLEIKRL